METGRGAVSCTTKSALGTGHHGRIIGLLREVLRFLMVVNGREWSIKSVMIGSGVADRNGVLLTLGALYVSGEATGGNKTFHRIQKGSIGLFGGYQTDVTGSFTNGSVEYVLSRAEMFQVR